MRGRPVGRGNPAPETFSLPPDFEWMRFGVCNDYDPDMWFPEDEAVDSGYAILKCEGCTVKFECLEFALETGQEFGVWGGLHSKGRRKRGRRVLAMMKRQRDGDG